MFDYIINDDNKLRSIFSLNNGYNSLINQLILKAIESPLEHKLAAGIIQNNKLVSKPYCNTARTIINKVNIGSLHAESHCIYKFFGSSFYYNKKKNIAYIPKDYIKKQGNIDLIVIRINKMNEICNSRPCYNCLNMMKAVGIRKVYYSISANKIISENVKDMISIQASSVTRLIELSGYKYNKLIFDNTSKFLYYESLLRVNFPLYIKKVNLQYFINYNLLDILPNYTIQIKIINDIEYIYILNTNNIIIVKSIIVK